MNTQLCIFSRTSVERETTFIRAHIEGLDARVTHVYGSYLPIAASGESRLLPFGSRRFNGAIARVLGWDLDTLQKRLWRRLPEPWRHRRLSRFLVQHGVQVVLAEYGPTGADILPACRLAGVPLAVHFHGFDVHRHATIEKFRPQYAELFRQAAALIVVSRRMADRLVEMGAPADKLHCIACGARVPRDNPAAPGDSPPLMIAVSRLVEVKGVPLTIEAFARARRRQPDLRLLIVGDGPCEAVVRETVERLGVQSAVEIAGALPHADALDRMRGARAFVQHSHRTAEVECEGAPVAVMEAACLGLPVIATRNGGIPDLVDEGVTGLLVDEGDVEAMAEAMVRLARDAALARRMGEAARRAAGPLTVDNALGRLMAVLNGIARPPRDEDWP